MLQNIQKLSYRRGTARSAVSLELEMLSTDAKRFRKNFMWKHLQNYVDDPESH